MFPANELPFDEELAIDAIQIADVHIEQLARRVTDAQNPIAQQAFDIRSILFRSAADKGELGQIARQTNARAHHDIGLGAATAEPFAGRVGKVVKFHG
jgi:hypothetical protein